MITYIVGAAIGFVVNELINEDKIEKLKQQQSQPQVYNPSIDGKTQIDQGNISSSGDDGNGDGTPLGNAGSDDVKEVKFVAKSRGKKKPKE